MKTRFYICLLSMAIFIPISFASFQDEEESNLDRDFFQQTIWKFSKEKFQNIETFCKASTQAVAQRYSVQTFDLSDGPVSNRHVESLTPVLQSSSLTTLILRDCQLDSMGGMILLQTLKGHSSLTSLDLSDNDIQEHAFCLMEDVFTKDSPLKILDISNNPLGFEAARFLSALLASGVPLEKLSLQYAGLNHRAVSVLGAGVVKSTTLQELDISGNKIGELGAATLFGLLSTGGSLKHLKAPYEKIGIAGRRRILLGLKNNINLPEEKRLKSFRDDPVNQMLIEKLERREKAFSNLKKVDSLCELDFSHLQLKDDSIIEIVNAVFSQNSVVERLDLSYNLFSDAGALQVFSNVKLSSRKIEVNLSKNCVTEHGKENLFSDYKTSIVHKENESFIYMPITVKVDVKKLTEKITSVSAASTSSGVSIETREVSKGLEHDIPCSPEKESVSVIVF